jgi:hypothetical protein
VEAHVIEITLVETGQRSHCQYFQVTRLGLGGGLHDRLVAVNRGEMRATLGKVLDRARHCFRNVEEFQVHEHFLVVGQQPVEQRKEARRHA